jgi:tetratricopeptide (TPR) repeat protein
MGALRTTKRSFAMKEVLSWLNRMVKKNVWESLDWRIQMMMLYVFGYEGKGVFTPKVVQALESPNPKIRCTAVVCSAFPSVPPPKMLQLLKKLAKEDAEPYIRRTARGVLLHIACRDKLPELNEMHRYLKEQQGSEGEAGRIVGAWAYGLLWHNLEIVPHLLLQEPEQIEEHVFREFIKTSYDPVLRKEYIFRLEKSLDLLAGLYQKEIYQKDVYLLALLYQQEGRYDKAASLLQNALERLGDRDTHFTFLWARILLRQGRTQEVKEKFKTLLQSLPKPSSFDLRTMKRHALYESQLRRGLGLAYLENQENTERTFLLLQEQYLLTPSHPLSLMALGEYYFQKKEYSQAANVFNELWARLPRHDETLVWLARVYAAKNDVGRMLTCLKYAMIWNRFLSWIDLENYPEFRPFRENPEVQNLLRRR